MVDDPHGDAIIAAAKANKGHAAKGESLVGEEETYQALLDRLAKSTVPLKFDGSDFPDISEEAVSSLIDPETGQVTISSLAHKCMVLHLQGFGFAEIARMCGCAAQTAAKHIRDPEIQKRIAHIMAITENELSSLQLLALDRLRRSLVSGDSKVELRAVELVLKAAGRLEKIAADSEDATSSFKEILAAITSKHTDIAGNQTETKSQIRVIDHKARHNVIDVMSTPEEKPEKARFG